MSIMNLLPIDYQQQRSRRRANVLCLVLFVIIMVGVVGASWVSDSKANALQLANEEISQEYRQAAKSIEQIRQLEARKQQVIAKAKTAAELLERVPRSYLLACLTNALPEGASLTAVKLRSTARKVTPQAAQKKNRFRSRAARRRQQEQVATKAIRPKIKVALEVTGLARTDLEVAQFISTMQSNPLLRSVELVYSAEEEVDGEILREFQVTMELTTGAEVEADTMQTASVAATALNAATDGRNH